MAEKSHREELIELFEQFPITGLQAVQSTLVDGQLFKAVMESGAVADMPDDIRESFTRQFVQGIIDTFKKDIDELVKYWHSHIPDDEVLDAMTDEEFETEIIDKFMEELEKTFMGVPERFAEACMRGEYPYS